mmetsp:Transcript_6434/g.9351  ORF Transcript_6434/g.9351 Transcript_6434/m.9351 type:complete len:137 (-) Transcript_6434:581-991(-)
MIVQIKIRKPRLDVIGNQADEKHCPAMRNKIPIKGNHQRFRRIEDLSTIADSLPYNTRATVMYRQQIEKTTVGMRLIKISVFCLFQVPLHKAYHPVFPTCSLSERLFVKSRFTMILITNKHNAKQRMKFLAKNDMR